MQKIKKNLGIGQILLSAVFLFNPEVSVIDPLPDFIGYLLLVTGLTCLADLNETLATARKLFLILAWVSGAQLLSVLFLFGAGASADRAMNFLLFPFCFGILSTLLAIPAFKFLFDGLLYLGTRHNGTAVFRGAGKKEPVPGQFAAVDHLRFLTYVFLIFKTVMTVLPEFAVLSAYGQDLNAVNWSRFLPLFRMGAIIVVLPFGIVWLCRYIGFFRAVRNDGEFIGTLTEKYRTEVLTKESVFVLRTVFRAFLLLGAAAVFSMDFYLNRYNVLPDFIAGICIFLAVLLLRKYLKKPNFLLAGSAVYTVVAAVEWILYTLFVRSSRYRDIYVDIRLMAPDAVSGHYLTSVVYGVSEVLFLCLFVLLVIQLLGFVRNYTCFPVNPSLHDSEARLRLEQKPLRVGLYIAVLLAAVCAGLAVCLRIFIPYATVKRFSFSELLTLLSAIASIAWAAEFCVTLAAIRAQVKNKYWLD